MHPIVFQIAVVAWSILLPYFAPSRQAVFLHKLLLPTRVTPKYQSVNSQSFNNRSSVDMDVDVDAGYFFDGSPTTSVELDSLGIQYVVILMMLFTVVSFWALLFKFVHKSESGHWKAAKSVDINTLPSISVNPCDRCSSESQCLKLPVVAMESTQDNTMINDSWEPYRMRTVTHEESRSVLLDGPTLQSDSSKTLIGESYLEGKKEKCGGVNCALKPVIGYSDKLTEEHFPASELSSLSLSVSSANDLKPRKLSRIPIASRYSSSDLPDSSCFPRILSESLTGIAPTRPKPTKDLEYPSTTKSQMRTRDTYAPSAYPITRTGDSQTTSQSGDYISDYYSDTTPREAEDMWEYEVKNIRRELATAKKSHQKYMKAAYRERYSSFRKQSKDIKTRTYNGSSPRYENTRYPYNGSIDYNYNDTCLSASDLSEFRSGFITSTPRSSLRNLHSSLDRNGSLRISGSRTVKHQH